MDDGYYEDGDTGYGFTEDAGTEEAETAEEGRKQAENPYVLNHELRLVNAYFKEVGMESLMSAGEEVRNAAKIKVSGAEKLRIEKNIAALLGRKNNQDFVKLMADAREMAGCEESAADPGGPTVEGIRRLIRLHDAYTAAEARLKGRFVKANLRLVASLAKRYVGRGVPFLDLIQEGNLGLMKAVDRYDHTRGYRFSTYACWWINQAMIRGVFNQNRTVKIPAYVLEKAGKVWTERARFMEERGREPLPAEIAPAVEMSAENVKQVLESATTRNTVRLDSPVWKGNRATFADYLADEESVPVDSLIAEFSIPKCVGHALHILDSREREILKMRFGIGYEGRFTLDEIGKKFDLTRERIRQIEKSALSTLRNSSSAAALRSLIEQN
jgi:RNA polymerase sigma factor (sigma-70 family)